MRHAELVLRPEGRGFHPADREIIDAEGVERVAIHHFNQLDDGTVVFLYQLRGDPERAKDVLSDYSDVLAHSISRSETELHAYIHIDPNELVETIFRLPQEHSLVVETPIECLADGGIRATVLGDEETFSRALEIVPDDIELELESIRDYAPDHRQLFSALTERQQEILETAIDVGYYDVPRDATQADIAAQLDLAAVTVGEHLRKIEAQVLPRIVSAPTE